MNTNAVVAVLSGAGLAAVAAAQTPSFVYSMQAPAVASPGQTFVMTVLCGFSPGVGQPVSTPIGPRPVLGLSSGAFTIASSGGSWSNLTLLPPFNFIGTTAGTPAGGNVNGVIWGNGFGPPIGTVSTVNPTPIWQGTYTFPTFYPTITLSPVGSHGVWAGNPGEFAVESLSPFTTGAQITFIPAPGVATLFAFTGLVMPRRRR